MRARLDSSRPGLCLTLGLLLQALVARPALASGPRSSLGLRVSGSCPRTAEVEAALATIGVAARPGWSLHLTPRPAGARSGGTRLRLVRPDGQTVLARDLAGDDCRAMAEAAAVLVQAHFVQLAARAPTTRPVPPARPTRVTTRGPAAKKPATGRFRLGLGLSAGLTVAPLPAAAAPTGQLDLGLRWPWLGLVSRLAASIDGPTEQSSAADRIRRRELRLRLEVGLLAPVGRSFGVLPAVGAGASLATTPRPTGFTGWSAVSGCRPPTSRTWCSGSLPAPIDGCTRPRWKTSAPGSAASPCASPRIAGAGGGCGRSSAGSSAPPPRPRRGRSPRRKSG